MFWLWCLTFFTGNMNLVVLLTGLLLGNSTTNVDDLNINHVLENREELALRQAWTEYKAEFDKQYDSDEEEYLRMEIFEENSKMINEHNEQFRKGFFSYQLGHNQFSDITHQEYLEKVLNIQDTNGEPTVKASPTVKYDIWEELKGNPTVKASPTVKYDIWEELKGNPTVKANPTVKYDIWEEAKGNPTVKASPTVKYDIWGDVEGNPTVKANPTVKYEDFNDLNEEEYESPGEFTFMPPENYEVPIHVDWRSHGAVTPVKDEGHCGASWAFSAIGALESQLFRKTHHLIPLSEQNLIDCTGHYGNHGCRNGTAVNSYRYIAKNKGIDTNITYPYHGKQQWFCHYKKYSNNPTIRGIGHIAKGNETALAVAVASAGPMSVAVDARSQKFRFYKNGVFNEPHCSTSNPNREMLVVGYGRSFWVVKNSWGKRWGIGGYIYMTRHMGNQCGIATRAVFPLV